MGPPVKLSKQRRSPGRSVNNQEPGDRVQAHKQQDERKCGLLLQNQAGQTRSGNALSHPQYNGSTSSSRTCRSHSAACVSGIVLECFAFHVKACPARTLCRNSRGDAVRNWNAGGARGHRLTGFSRRAGNPLFELFASKQNLFGMKPAKRDGSVHGCTPCSDRNSLHRQARTAAEPLIQGFDQPPELAKGAALRDRGLAERRRQPGVTKHGQA